MSPTHAGRVSALWITFMSVHGCHTTPLVRDELPSPKSVTQLALAGRTARQLERLGSVPAVKVLDQRGSSSAVLLRADLALLCKHSLASNVRLLEIDGVRRRVELMAAGATTAWRDDWAVLRIDPPCIGRRLIQVDPRPVLPPGEVILLVGYWYGSATPSFDDARRGGRVVIEGVVTSPPEHPMAPSSAFVCCSLPYPDVLKGLSGAPAVVWNERLGDWVLAGFYRGAWQLKTTKGSVLASTHLVRRLPEHGLELACADPR